MKHSWKRHIFSFMIAIGCGISLAGSAYFTVHAEVIDYQAQAEAHRLMPIESNEIKNWPQGPAVSAKSAILMEANTGTILYAKNIHESLFPASTTKILTAYIARQESALNEVVEYSSAAVNSINWREDSNIGIRVGEAITMEQSLYGLLVGSANECGNAIGEHISGSIEDFAALMNRTAQELGCTDSHFVTTNGIHDEEHYTSAHDLAVIARKFFDDELLCKMSGTASYVIPASGTLSRQLIPNSKNRLLPGKTYAYEYLVGSKTGFTAAARQNLVSCAQKDGLKLICVVMDDEAPMQYTDTIDLFNYGFSNFSSVNVSENDTTYSVKSGNFFTTDNVIFGDAAPILSIDKNASLVLPASVSFEDLTSELSYEDAGKGQAAVIHYSYSGQPMGTAPVLFADKVAGFDFNAEPVIPAEVSGTESNGTEAPGSRVSDDKSASETGMQPEQTVPDPGKQADGNTSGEHVVFLNIKSTLLIVGAITLLLITLLIIRSVIHNHNLTKRRRAIMKRRRDHKNEIIDFDRYIDHF